MEQTNADTWRPCSSCKKSIPLNSKYYVCSVSTCNNQRTGYVFCSVPCFERHLPIARHRDAGAIEKKAPSAPDSDVANTTVAQSATTRPPARVIAPAKDTKQLSAKSQLPKEVLVIASRLKDYIQARSDYNTSGSVMDVLSDHLRILCDRAIDNARAEGRKTVMDRDFDFLKSLK